MNCYTCNQHGRNAIMRYGMDDAIGVCHNCGIAVCAKHSHKDEKPGAPLLCIPCATLHGTVPAIKGVEDVRRKKNAANL